MAKRTGRIELPEDLTKLPAADLQGLFDQTTEAIAPLADSEDVTDEDINEIERLDQIAQALRGEQDARSEAKANRVARRDQVLQRINGTPEVDQVDVEDETDEGDEDEADEVEAESEPAPVAVAAATRSAAQLARKGGTAALKARRPAANAPKVETGLQPWKASKWATGHHAGDDILDTKAVALAMSETRNSSRFPMQSNGPAEYWTIATGQKVIQAPDGSRPQMTADYHHNFSVIRDAQARVRQAAKETAALVASGGTMTPVRSDLAGSFSALVASGACCTPLTPMYDFFRLAEPQTPVEDALPTVEAPRGGVRYIVPPDYQRLFAAIGIQNCADNANPNSPMLKPCLHVDCPAIAEQTVTAISQCVTFGNLGYRTFPEQVEAFLEDLAVAFATTKEINYLNTIDANSTAVTSTTAYGATRALNFDLNLAAIAYRKRHGMARNSVLQVLLPDWTIDLMKTDLVNDGYEGLQWLNVPDADVVTALRSHNLDPVFFNDTASFVASTGTSGTTSASLTAGTVVTAIPVNALAAAVPAGTVQITQAGTGQQQFFVTTGAASGATSIPVTSTSVNFAYSSGATVGAVTFSPNQKFNQIQAASTLNPWPGSVTWYMFAPGTFVRMDGGSLDIGLVRDSTLNRTNDLQIFQEEWVGVVMLGLESIKCTSVVCPSGAGAQTVAPITCTSTSESGQGLIAAGTVAEKSGTTTTLAGEY